MIIPDLNILLYAINSTDQRHLQAKAWWNKLLHGEETIGLPWVIRLGYPLGLSAWVFCLGFLRISMRCEALNNPLRFDQAVGALQLWTSMDHVIDLVATPQHLDVVSTLTTDITAGNKAMTDLHIAALSVEYIRGI